MTPLTLCSTPSPSEPSIPSSSASRRSPVCSTGSSKSSPSLIPLKFDDLVEHCPQRPSASESSIPTSSTPSTISSVCPTESSKSSDSLIPLRLDGSVDLAQRLRHLNHRYPSSAYRKHPERFVGKPPNPSLYPWLSWINPPAQTRFNHLSSAIQPTATLNSFVHLSQD